jgi:hypothetical protein
MEPKNRGPVWAVLIVAVLLVLLILLAGRGCRDERGDLPPALPDTLGTDTLDADTMMSPDPRDTTLTDTTSPPATPRHGPPAWPGAPAVMP